MLIGSNLNEFGYRNRRIITPQTMEQVKATLTERYGEENAEKYIEAYQAAYPDDDQPQHILTTTVRGNVIRQASVKHAQNGAPVYLYLFEWQSPVNDGSLGAAHGMELPFMFNNIAMARTTTGGGKKAYELADKISSAWISFVKTGDPNCEELPQWPAYAPSSVIWFCASIACELSASQYASAQRAQYNFNPGWRVYVGDPDGAEAIDFDDSSWKNVALPYAWNEDDAYRLSIARLPTGVAWYREHFRLPPGSEGKKVFLEFQGVRFAAEVWVNGANIGLHENGVMAFGLDVTDVVHPAGKENVIAVRTDSSWNYRERATGQRYQWNDRNFNVPYGGRAMGCREMLASDVAEWGGEMLYINKSATKPLWMTEYSRDEGLRKWWDEFSPPFHEDGSGRGRGAVYNRNQDSHAIEDVLRWYDYWRERPGTGVRVNAGAVNIIFSDTNTHYRGSENYRRSGEVDPVRLPKDGYFAHQIMWDGWVNVEEPGVHLIGHWNYTPETTKNVYAVSSADKVELRLNGRSLGFGQQSHRFLFTFPDVAWEPGVLTAIAYDENDEKVAEASHETASQPTSIRLTLHTGPDGLVGNHADLALVDVEVCDAEGRRCPTALNEITFELDGPAEWRGGIAQGPGNYVLSQTLPVECGVNRVLVRSAAEAGDIRLTATAESLESATLEFTSRPVEVTDGWSLTFPGTDLPSYTERGPTPSGESVVPTRTAIAIASATAGGNGDRAALSYDDESTEWTNSGGVENVWIRYQLERPARVNEITMKLGEDLAQWLPGIPHSNRRRLPRW